MGLDMYVYKVSKPSLNPDRVYERSELREYAIILPDDTTSDLYAQVIPFTQKLRVINSYYNMDKIREDFRMPDADLQMISSEKIIVGGTVDGTTASQEISTEQIESLYTIKREEDCHVYALELASYWRKEYSLQARISESLGGCIENSGFYLLDEVTVRAINCFCNLSEHIDWYPPTGTSALFYHEWY